MTLNTIFSLLLVFMLCDCLSQCSQNNVYQDMLNKNTLNFTQIADKVGYAVNEYDVVTQDAYILKLFHIPGDRSRPVLLTHGIIDSADTFIIRGNTSLATTLARAGYDVWIANARGNRYCRRHVYLDPDSDPEFWDFSFHEIAFYDLPAIIDFILDNTGQKSLSAVGHSQGNTIFIVLGITRPEYNEKINVMVSISPICFLSNIKNAVLLSAQTIPVLDRVYSVTGQEEFFGDDTITGRFYRTVCGCKKNYVLCAYGLFFPLSGLDPEEMEPDFFPTIVAHYPTGTSIKNAKHLSQIALKRRFAEYDYEWRNMDVYNSSVPPDYDLSKVRMKVALLVGRNDAISTLRDVVLLRDRLPNVVEYRILPHKRFNHIDGVWGRNMGKYLFPDVLDVLAKYS